MRRAVIGVLAALAFSPSARADLVPAGKKVIPRHTEIRDLDKAGDDVLVLHPCHPAKGGDFAQDYCVIESSGPFRLQGAPYFLPRKRVHSEPVKDSRGTPDAPRAIRIQELASYGVETNEFFDKSALARRQGELRATDGMTLSADSDLMKVTDVWRVVRGSNGDAEVRAEKISFQCRTGEKLERTPPRDPLREPLDIPKCPRDRTAVQPASSSPLPKPVQPAIETATTRSFPELAAALGIGFLLIGGVAALASRKRAE
jgi:hypothetical protein